MKRDNHYERAFESFLRQRRIPYLAISEQRRNIAPDGTTVKTPDFLLSPPHRTPWIVDVKGRRFPGRGGAWKHWTTWDDFVGMRRWESVFGQGGEGLFVFAYQICGSTAPLPEERLFSYNKRLYAFVALRSRDYWPEARLLSPRWNTYSMPVGRFRALARPIEDFLTPLPPPAVSSFSRPSTVSGNPRYHF